jgi:hypothetical protein
MLFAPSDKFGTFARVKHAPSPFLAAVHHSPSVLPNDLFSIADRRVSQLMASEETLWIYHRVLPKRWSSSLSNEYSVSSSNPADGLSSSDTTSHSPHPQRLGITMLSRDVAIIF